MRVPKPHERSDSTKRGALHCFESTGLEGLLGRTLT